jgi:C-terminal processing protease CtpA/Prc
MIKRNLRFGVGIAALCVALIALPSPSASRQSAQDDALLAEKLQKLQSEVDAVSSDRALQKYAEAFAVSQEMAELQQPGIQDFTMVLGDEGASWLGVETQEVSSEFAKEHKLSAERGVVLHRIISDSPAAKSGLEENDVVTEINGQRVEGAAQFRRMIREIPSGRTAQLTVIRDGSTRSISVTLGESERAQRVFTSPATSGSFAFRVPDVPDVPGIAELPRMEWSNGMLLGGQPRLGIDAEDLSGQLGTFFGAPDGEGILVREVNSGSAAEKAGLKAGDVITSLDGERIRTIGEMREKLAAKRDDKGTSAKLDVLRNKSQVSLTVELPPPTSKSKRMVLHRTNI